MGHLIHTREVASSIPAAPNEEGPGNRAFLLLQALPWEFGEAILEMSWKLARGMSHD